MAEKKPGVGSLFKKKTKKVNKVSTAALPGSGQHIDAEALSVVKKAEGTDDGWAEKEDKGKKVAATKKGIGDLAAAHQEEEKRRRAAEAAAEAEVRKKVVAGGGTSWGAKKKEPDDEAETEGAAEGAATGAEAAAEGEGGDSEASASEVAKPKLFQARRIGG
eukprot:CAMPEP_0172586246 /NCGR_PEP_ID=MMETSP1068-20121228/5624_1 /TAXON_ID=35684 /ORGANISM="Pseudopedinella elastica, Strain CCMP716" /LENGTH=161 /DNA_ID=CAMNT_0013380983 /DNA_START=55 /DNA_END=536 /DNA_ORIENTATION=+